MKQTNEISLKYTGAAVNDGSIEAGDLISGLNGLIKVSDVILREYQPSKEKQISLRVNKFEKGSFETVLVFVESHPVLTGSATGIVVCLIDLLVNYIIGKKSAEQNDKRSDEIKKILSAILDSQSKTNKILRGFHEMALPLRDRGIEALEFGFKNETKPLIDQGNKDKFISEEDVEEVHRSISLAGAIRSLDKKTLGGKFTTEEGVTYSIRLIMDAPEDYFHYFNDDSVIIRGVATIEKSGEEITKIEVERIEAKAAAAAEQAEAERAEAEKIAN